MTTSLLSSARVYIMDVLSQQGTASFIPTVCCFKVFLGLMHPYWMVAFSMYSLLGVVPLMLATSMYQRPG